MMSASFSRRRLLGSVLTALTGCLLPCRSRTSAAPPRTTPPARHDATHYRVVSTTYSYDGSRRLFCTTDYFPNEAENGPWPSQG